MSEADKKSNISTSSRATGKGGKPSSFSKGGGFSIRFSNTRQDGASEDEEDNIAIMQKSESMTEIKSAAPIHKPAAASVRSASLELPDETKTVTKSVSLEGNTESQTKDLTPSSSQVTKDVHVHDVPRSFIGGLRKKISKKIEERKVQLETSPLTEQFPIITKVLENISDQKSDRSSAEFHGESQKAAAVSVRELEKSTDRAYQAKMVESLIVRGVKTDVVDEVAAKQVVSKEGTSVEMAQEADEAGEAVDSNFGQSERIAHFSEFTDYISPLTAGVDGETVAFVSVPGTQTSSKEPSTSRSGYLGQPNPKIASVSQPKPKHAKTKQLSDKVTMSSLLNRKIDEQEEDVELDDKLYMAGSVDQDNAVQDEELEIVDKDGLVTEAAVVAEDTSEVFPSMPKPIAKKKLLSSSLMQKLLFVLFLLSLFHFLPLPGHIKGAVVGVVISAVVHKIFNKVFEPSKQKKPLQMLPLKELSPMLKPEVPFLQVKLGTGEIYKVIIF